MSNTVLKIICNSLGVFLPRTGRSGIRIPAERRNFPLLQTFRPALEPKKPPIQQVPAFFPGVKQPRHDADSPLSSVEVKNDCGRTSAFTGTNLPFTYVGNFSDKFALNFRTIFASSCEYTDQPRGLVVRASDY